jgi:hypothetical protein
VEPLESDPLDWMAGLIWTFSLVREGFERRHLPRLEIPAQTCPLTRENVAILTSPPGGGKGIRTPDLLTARRIRAISPSRPSPANLVKSPVQTGNCSSHHCPPLTVSVRCSPPSRGDSAGMGPFTERQFGLVAITRITPVRGYLVRY